MLQSNGRLGLWIAAFALIGLGAGCNFLGIEPIELSEAESDSEPRDGGKGGESGGGGESGVSGFPAPVTTSQAGRYLFVRFHHRICRRSPAD